MFHVDGMGLFEKMASRTFIAYQKETMPGSSQLKGGYSF
jgi:hypothetical protein